MFSKLIECLLLRHGVTVTMGCGHIIESIHNSYQASTQRYTVAVQSLGITSTMKDMMVKGIHMG